MSFLFFNGIFSTEESIGSNEDYFYSKSLKTLVLTLEVNVTQHEFPGSIH